MNDERKTRLPTLHPVLRFHVRLAPLSTPQRPNYVTLSTDEIMAIGAEKSLFEQPGDAWRLLGDAEPKQQQRYDKTAAK